MAYGTDGQLAALGLKVLTDTKQIQPVYAPTPIIRGKILQENPDGELPERETLFGSSFYLCPSISHFFRCSLPPTPLH
ncbi:MAG: hypothetical protein JEY71_10945 [Sphaerochaeta sp.]|nr:hypothetical protein [Sphaerochaeta sp.]